MARFSKPHPSLWLVSEGGGWGWEIKRHTIDNMKNFRLALLGGALVLAPACFASSEIAWTPSYDAAVSRASADHKLIMIDFYTDWCVWCKRLDANTYTNPSVVSETSHVVPVKLNAEKEGADLAKKYGVNGYPTIVFTDAKGNLVSKVVGYEEPPQFKSDVATAVDAYQNTSTYQDRLAKDPNDAEANERLAVIYAKQGNADKAAPLVTAAERLDPNNKVGLLAKALNCMGDYYQNAGDADGIKKSLDCYTRARKAAKDPADIAYADESMAQDYFALNEKHSAIVPLKDALSLKSLSDSERKMCNDMLAEAQKG